MKTLYLLRHAKSSWADEGLDDFDRPLAKRGEKAAPKMAARMRDEGWIPQLVLVSAARRATETWERIAPVLSADSARLEPGLYMAPADALLERVRALPDDAASALLLGHNPGMEDFARLLAGDGGKKELKRLRKKYPTGALAVIRFEGDRWTDVGAGTGTLHAFVRPKDL